METEIGDDDGVSGPAQETTIAVTKNENISAFPTWVLNTGFITALVLSGFCLLLAAYYMIKFQNLSSAGINQVVDITMKKGIVETQVKAIPNANDYQMIRLALATNMYIARILLLSCGVFIGLAFGFLGFSLFLVGVKGTIDASLTANDKYKLQIARLSPGLFVILCATILIGVCATRSLPVDMNQKNENEFGLKQSDHREIEQMLDSIKKGADPGQDTTMPQ
jgi:hypothetical protein